MEANGECWLEIPRLTDCTKTGASIGTASSTGRGTFVITATNPTATYNLIYYLIDNNSALLLDKDSSLVLRGSLARQF